MSSSQPYPILFPFSHLFLFLPVELLVFHLVPQSLPVGRQFLDFARQRLVGLLGSVQLLPQQGVHVR